MRITYSEQKVDRQVIKAKKPNVFDYLDWFFLRKPLPQDSVVYKTMATVYFDPNKDTGPFAESDILTDENHVRWRVLHALGHENTLLIVQQLDASAVPVTLGQHLALVYSPYREMNVI